MGSCVLLFHGKSAFGHVGTSGVSGCIQDFDGVRIADEGVSINEGEDEFVVGVSGVAEIREDFASRIESFGEACDEAVYFGAGGSGVSSLGETGQS